MFTILHSWAKEPPEIASDLIENAMRAWPNKLGDLRENLARHGPSAYGLFDHVPATDTAPGRPPTPDDIKARASAFNGSRLGFLCSSLDEKVSD